MPDNNVVQYTNPPQSRNEAILESIVEGTEYNDPPESRIEDLLLQVKEAFEEGGGGGGGTTVVANPTLTSIEENLEAIKIGNGKYNNPIDGLTYDMGLFSTFAVIGDSFASGNIGSDNTKMRWGQILANRFGIGYLHLSKGGLSTRTWLTDANGLAKMQSSAAQDLYIFALGINDSKISNYIGAITDITNYNDPSQYPDTFYGNYGKIIEAVRTKAPGARLIMTTVAPNIANINTAIRAIAQYYQIPLIDIVNDVFFSDTSYWKASFYGGHPSALGYSSMAKRYAFLISKCITTNKEYFRYMYIPELAYITATKSDTVIPLNGEVTTNDITVTATMTTGTTKNVTSSASINTSGVNTAVEGTYQIVVSYTEGGITKTDTITVTVEDISQKTLVEITASVTNTTVIQGQTYTPQGLVVTAQYSDSSEENVTSSAQVGTIDTSTTGNKSLNISYTEGGITKDTSITIEVIALAEPTLIYDISFVKEITAYNNFGAPTIHDGKGYKPSSGASSFGKVDFDASEDGRALYYKLTGTGIEHGCGNFNTQIGSTTILNNYTLALANDWTPLLDKNGNQVYAESGKAFSTAFGSGSNSGATFPISLNCRLYIGYV